MKSKIKVIFQNQQKAVKIPSGIRLLLRRACNAVIEMEELPDSYEVCVTFVDNDTIRKINREHRNIDKETDVLSFPLGENGEYDENPETGNRMLGDVVLSVEKAVAQAEEYGHSLNREAAYLTVHSMLHLLGYDHVNGGLEQVRMREKEETVMQSIGYPKDSTYILTDEMMDREKNKWIG